MNAPRQFTGAELDTIRKMRLDGVSFMKIGAELKTSPENVSRLAKQLGVHTLPSKNPDEATLRAAYDDFIALRKTYQALNQELGTKQGRLRDLWNRLGLPPMPHSLRHRTPHRVSDRQAEVERETLEMRRQWDAERAQMKRARELRKHRHGVAA